MEEKVSTFTMEVGDNVWADIEKEIEFDESRNRKGAMWWFTLSFSSLAAFLLIALLYGNTDTNSIVNVTNSSIERTNIVSQNQSNSSKSEEKIPNENLDGVYNSANRTQASITGNASPSINSTTTKNATSSAHSTHTQKHFQPSNGASTRYSSQTNDRSGVQPIKESPKTALASEEKPVNVEEEKEVVKEIEQTRNKLRVEQEKAITKEKAKEQICIVEPEQKLIRMAPCISQPLLSKWSVIAYGGPGMAYRNLSGETNAQGIVDHRNSHEQNAMTFDAGIAGKRDFGNASYALVGLNYSRYAEKYDFHHDVISHTTVNDYGYLQLSLNYGRRIAQLGNKSSISAFGGFRIGKLLHAQSSWIDPTALSAVAHSNVQTNQPFEVWNYGYNVGLDYEVRVSRRFSLHLIPLLEGMFNSSYKKETLLTQRPYAVTLNAGVSYRF